MFWTALLSLQGTEGPASYATSGVVGGMILCPANGADKFRIFNGNDGAYNASQVAIYRDSM